MNTSSQSSLGQACLRRARSTAVFGVAAALLAANLIPVPLQAADRGAIVPGPGFGSRNVRVVADPRGGPHFLSGPRGDDFFFVRGAPEGRFIDSRDSLLAYLLAPVADSVAWGLGAVTTVEVANMLGVPVNTVVYGVEPDIAVYSTLPQGYFVAESIPSGVALVRRDPRGSPVVLYRRVPPGAFVAYQVSAGGIVLNQCLVVPPVQQVVVPAATPAPQAVYVATPPVTAVTTAAPATTVAAPPVVAAPAETASVPMSSKTGKIQYDANGKPSGVIVQDADGKFEYVPIEP